MTGQDPIWSVGSTVVKFPGAPGASIETYELPTPDHPNLPAAYRYQGAMAQRTQNIQADDEGKVIFFIVGGNIYNGDGLLIADAALDIDDRNCETCFLGGEEVHIIPVPGSCTRYYVISLFFDSFEGAQGGGGQGGPNALTSSLLRWGVLDMSLKNEMSVYGDLCVPVNGRFLRRYDELDFMNIGLLPLAQWDEVNVEPINDPSPGNGGYFQDGIIYVSVVEGPEALYASSIQVDAAGRHLMVVRCNQGLVMLQVDENGVRKLSAATSNDNRWHYNQDPITTINDFDISQRGEVALHLQGSTLKVAVTSYDLQNFAELQGQPGRQTRVNYWAFQLTAGSIFSVSSTIVAAGLPGANPRTYSLDLYPVADPPPIDHAGNPITRPAVCGLEFSPNGRYIYFVKSPDFAYPNSGGPETNFGFIDADWVLGSPGTYHGYLPIAPPGETRKLADTQIGINIGPDGTGTALYVLGAEVDGYWLGAFTDPDAPDASNWQPMVIEFDEVSYRVEPASPLTRFKHVNRRPLGSTHTGYLAQEACCEDLVLASDRSTTITAEHCDLFWEPGDNDFWDTEGPVYIATELRIAQGAHVTAQNMEFRFGENAILIIEAGASLTCTNCLFTNACEDTRWKGIEVRGNLLGNQFGNPPTNQGKVVLRASTVQNAATGVLLGMSAPPWGFGAGGIVQASRSWVTEEDEEGNPVSFWKPTTFRNCRQGVRFMPYQNHLPNGTAFRNLSSFSDCIFTVDEDYPVAYDFQHHVNMHHVDGITFRACTFENTLPDAFFAMTGDFPGSLYLGHGIYSLDAHYSVGGSCNVPWPDGPTPCPDNQMRFSEFRGLDHGIHARSSSSLNNFSANRVRFTDNIAGVYSSAVVGFTVKNSIFSIGGRNVELTNPIEDPRWQDHHRGIYSHSSYGFTVQDNTLFKTSGSPADRLTEGVVIGYSRDHNDFVFRNHGEDLSVGFAGEGVSASLEPSYTHVIGLQLICNTNTNDDKNLSSRKANGADFDEQLTHTIRTNQGNIWRPADNEFDEWLGWLFRWDFEMTTTNGNISYWHRPGSPYEPLSHPSMLNPALVTSIPANNCASKLPSRIPADLPPGMAPGGLTYVVEAEKLAYGNTRYLYDQLIDGGNTDEVVQEITDAWPQDVWDLRASLLARSPYLSTGVLRELNVQNKLPTVLYAEVCIANPEATRADGFLQWLEDEAPNPLTPSLLGTIVASWDVRTYRTTLESTMADHHETMSQAANMLMEYISNDSTGLQVNALRTVWQEIRTPAARYAEALALMELGEYDAASIVVASIPQEHTKLRERELTEKDRMLSLIGFMQDLAASGRSDAELTVGEQDQLESLIAGQQDRPAMWMQNLLCFHYDRCVAPWTGGSGEPKSLPLVSAMEEEVPAWLSIFPNPATSWTVASLELPAGTHQATLRILDLSGKQVHLQVVPSEQPQLVLDTRRLAPGAYLVELSSFKGVLATERLIVQP